MRTIVAPMGLMGARLLLMRTNVAQDCCALAHMRAWWAETYPERAQ